MSSVAAWLLALALGAVAPLAQAHKASDAYLTLTRDAANVHGQWDIALRDLDAAIGLDRDGDGEITWGEVRARHPDIARYALARLDVRSGGEACPLAVREHLIDRHTDGAYAVLVLAGTCAAAGPTLDVAYRLFFDIDPQHRGLVHLVEPGGSTSVVFRPDASRQAIGGRTGSALAQVAMYAHEGVWHIWQGFDHVLFLLTLLLPAVLVRNVGAWGPVTSFRAAFVDVAKIVTAFTVAHSITLTLAALEIVSLPSRFVESAIALSVVLAALNNVRPVVGRGRWIAAFAFGLLHGFGFAGALQDLGLPTGALALSLFGFNLGVELGQLAMVALFLPFAFAFRARRAYQLGLVGGGSVAIAAIAAVWLVERAFAVPLLGVLAFAR